MAYSLAISIVKNGQIAEEVTQDAFLKAYKSLDKFEQRSKFSTWLYKIVTNEGLKRLRKKEFKYADDVGELNNINYSEINNKMDDDVRILLAEYRLALKKYNSKREI